MLLSSGAAVASLYYPCRHTFCPTPFPAPAVYERTASITRAVCKPLVIAHHVLCMALLNPTQPIHPRGAAKHILPAAPQWSGEAQDRGQLRFSFFHPHDRLLMAISMLAEASMSTLPLHSHDHHSSQRSAPSSDAHDTQRSKNGSAATADSSSGEHRGGGASVRAGGRGWSPVVEPYDARARTALYQVSRWMKVADQQVGSLQLWAPFGVSRVAWLDWVGLGPSAPRVAEAQSAVRSTWGRGGGRPCVWCDSGPHCSFWIQDVRGATQLSRGAHEL